LSAGKAEAIDRACDLIAQEGRFLDQFAVDAAQGGAGASTNMNANEVIANMALASNLIEATSDMGAFVLYSGVLKRIAVKLSKICNDLRLLSSRSARRWATRRVRASPSAPSPSGGAWPIWCSRKA
jgi:aspartate ammonia-lyase